jgi:hypothetical protein
MVGKVLNIKDFIYPDKLGCDIAAFWMTNHMLRQDWLTQMIELRKYIFATSTRDTTNAQDPWKNSTTIPKTCQIRDNLMANYELNLFPKGKKSIDWEADSQDANEMAKRECILSYTGYTRAQDRERNEYRKCIGDYVDYGNAFGTVEWIDERVSIPGLKEQVGYVGPSLRRISPLDIVFNPTAPSFRDSPKVVRSLVSIGEVKKILASQSNDQNRAEYEELFRYLREIRNTVRQFSTAGGELNGVDQSYQVDGFQSFQAYLQGDMVEVLTFYGDIYDWEKDEFLENHIITVVDRHKVIGKRPNPSYFGYAPIFHVGWRPRQDNLWAMGPLNNLIGMQFRLDHTENAKADLLDMYLVPPLVIKGATQDIKWGPAARFYVGDDGDVKPLTPPPQLMQSDGLLEWYLRTMEILAGAPQEQLGIRSPGEKTAFEVSKLDNAAQRIYGAKVMQFEQNFIEPCENAKLELARRNIAQSQTISVFDDDFNFQTFMTLTPQDITGAGRLKPIAARHFAEQAELLQNLTAFFNSQMGQDPAINVHFSGEKIAKMLAEIFGIKEYNVVQPYVRLAEQADAQRMAQAHNEQVGMEAQTPAGIHPDDHDPDVADVAQAPPLEVEPGPPPGSFEAA